MKCDAGQLYPFFTVDQDEGGRVGILPLHLKQEWSRATARQREFTTPCTFL